MEGRTYIPIGLNLCFPRHVVKREEGLNKMFRWLDRLSENGGNFARIFMGHAFFDIESGDFGTFDEEKASRLDAVLEYAWQRGVRLKLTIDLFRTVEEAEQAEIFPGAVSFSKPNFHTSNNGRFEDMDDYLLSREGRAHFLRKLDWLAERYGDHPGIFGWDLWNEMNAVSSVHWQSWTREMLVELKKRFPRHLAMQTLGSMDGDDSVRNYETIMPLASNEASQAHRYLDAGARYAICHGPVDVMMADAVGILLRVAPGKPAILAEGGAVERQHIGPWLLYPSDTEGIVLHDVLFAPFFAGAAGCGQAWHWQEYVDPNHLWAHYARFAKAIEGVDPIEQRLTPECWEANDLRVYALVGRTQCLVWCRETHSDWRTELVDHIPAGVVKGAKVTLPSRLGSNWQGRFYDPWTNRQSEPQAIVDGCVNIPDFRRSMVLRLERVEE
ncbi:MAG: hypothetical protein B9S32_09800 [Verrucomicrobia bacterium Tous-C9LFEB]|nr:MAG: hypothetical protein B9S32_09800 [Verrucomicrobia bacterium Tous-C9LFEB]